MGNEQAIPISEAGGSNTNLPAFSTRSPAISITPDYELLIVIRGQRHTGKTTIIRRMKGEPFTDEYTATPSLSASEIFWNSPKREKVHITIWDVVENALLPQDIAEKIEYPDATTVDTYKRTDGIIIMLDDRFNDTIKLASKILQEAPEDIPIVLFSNFQDVDEVKPIVPKDLRKFAGRFYFLPGSMQNNLGLAELNNWLSIPLARSKANLFKNKHLHLQEQLNAKIIEFAMTSEFFVDEETARQHIPKPMSINSSSSQNQQNQQNQQQKNQQRKKSDAQTTNQSQQQQQQQQQQQKQFQKKAKTGNEDDDFWSDDDTPMELDDNNKDESSDEALFAPNPMVKRFDLKSKAEAKQNTESKEINSKEKEDNKNNNIDKNEKITKKKPTLVQKALPKIEGKIDDSFFSGDDDDDDDNKIEENDQKIPILDEDSDEDEPLRPNPLVASAKNPKPSLTKPLKPVIKAKNTPNQQKEEKSVEKVEKANESSGKVDKIDIDKVEKVDKQQQKIEIPTIEDNAGNGGFFDDEDENDDEDEAKVVLNNEDDDDDEHLKPNPLVAANPKITPKVVPTKKAVVIKEAEKVEKIMPKEIEKVEHKEEIPLQIKKIEIPTIDEKVDDGFFDDNNDDDDENNTGVKIVDDDEEEEHSKKANILVTAKNTKVDKASNILLSQKEETESQLPQSQLSSSSSSSSQQPKKIEIPTINDQVDDDFFKDEENEGTEPKVEPAVEPKIEPKVEPLKENDTSVVNRAEIDIVIPIIEEKVDDDFFKEDEENEGTEPKVEPKIEPTAELKIEPKVEPAIEPLKENDTSVVNRAKIDIVIPILEEKVDDGFFDDDDDNVENDELPQNFDEKEESDGDSTPVRSNPLVASNIKSTLQTKILQKIDQQHHEEEFEQQQLQLQQHETEENENSNNFFANNHNEDNKNSNSNNDSVQDAAEEETNGGHGGYDGYDDTLNESHETEPAPKASIYKKPKKIRKSRGANKRTAPPMNNSTQEEAPPAPSGDYDTL